MKTILKNRILQTLRMDFIIPHSQNPHSEIIATSNQLLREAKEEINHFYLLSRDFSVPEDEYEPLKLLEPLFFDQTVNEFIHRIIDKSGSIQHTILNKILMSKIEMLVLDHFGHPYDDLHTELQTIDKRARVTLSFTLLLVIAEINELLKQPLSDNSDKQCLALHKTLITALKVSKSLSYIQGFDCAFSSAVFQTILKRHTKESIIISKEGSSYGGMNSDVWSHYKDFIETEITRKLSSNQTTHKQVRKMIERKSNKQLPESTYFDWVKKIKNGKPLFLKLDHSNK